MFLLYHENTKIKRVCLFFNGLYTILVYKGQNTWNWEDSFFYTTCRIGGKAGSLGIVKGRDCLNESNGADRNQVILILVVGVVFFDNVGNQPQIVLNELVAGLGISLFDSLKALLFLLGGKRLGKGTIAGDM